MHPDYPKPTVWTNERGIKCVKPAALHELQEFFRAHPEFANEGRYEFQCPYCGNKVGYEPTQECCGEVHGDWVLVKDGDA
jgi:hypothetical protein